MGILTMDTLSTFKTAFHIMKKDKVILFFSLVPILIGIVGFYFLFDVMFVDLKSWTMAQIGFSSAPDSVWGRVVGGFLTVLITVLYYFAINFFFVLFVSIVSSPFNDLISARVEKNIISDSVTATSTDGIIQKIGGILLNEIKKICFIGCVSLVAVLLGLFPFFVPVSILLSSILLAVNFLDYSWSRQDLTFTQCLKNVKHSYFSYGISGFIFLSGFSIPFFNLLLLPYAVVYYTVIYTNSTTSFSNSG